MVNYKPLTREQAVCALYNKAKVQGLGILHSSMKNMTLEEAKAILAKGDTECGRCHATYLDYVKGRVIKIKFYSDTTEINEALYDRDNGQGAAQRAIDEYKKEHNISDNLDS